MGRLYAESNGKATDGFEPKGEGIPFAFSGDHSGHNASQEPSHEAIAGSREEREVAAKRCPSDKAFKKHTRRGRATEETRIRGRHQDERGRDGAVITQKEGEEVAGLCAKKF